MVNMCNNAKISYVISVFHSIFIIYEKWNGANYKNYKGFVHVNKCLFCQTGSLKYEKGTGATIKSCNLTNAFRPNIYVRSIFLCEIKDFYVAIVKLCSLFIGSPPLNLSFTLIAVYYIMPPIPPMPAIADISGVLVSSGISITAA